MQNYALVLLHLKDIGPIEVGSWKDVGNLCIPLAKILYDFSIRQWQGTIKVLNHRTDIQITELRGLRQVCYQSPTGPPNVQVFITWYCRCAQNASSRSGYRKRTFDENWVRSIL